MHTANYFDLGLGGFTVELPLSCAPPQPGDVIIGNVIGGFPCQVWGNLISGDALFSLKVDVTDNCQQPPDCVR